MASNTRKVVVEDLGTYDVDRSLSQSEVRRNLQTLLGASWLAGATFCEKSNGDFEFKRPPAAPKG